jgi:metal-responsive CopG/Arc/MetJ family transcriptional regulator
MAVSTINISFQDDLLHQIDQIAQNEARTRSELITEAVRVYAEKKDWEQLCAYGQGLASRYQFTEDDVNEEIKKYREEKSKK